MITTADQYINMAMKAHTVEREMLTVSEFIEVAKYPIDKLYIDRFWASLYDNQLVYVDDELLKWMGFEAADAKYRKKHFIELIKANNIEYIKYSNDEYNKLLLECSYTHSKLYPLAPTGRGTSTTKHLLLNADSLKLAMMTISRGKGKHVREYYISLEKLFKVYVTYQSRFKDMQTDKAILVLKKEHAENVGYLSRLEAINHELIEYKHFLAKTEFLYIGSTFDQARQGLFKVSRTANLKARNAVHNNTHPRGDEFIILYTVKCRSALPLEQRVKYVLQHFRPVSSREYYQLPFNLLVQAVEKLDNDIGDEEDLANELMNIMTKMKLTQDKIDWLANVPQDIFLLPLPSELPALMPASLPAELISDDKSVSSADDDAPIIPIPTSTISPLVAKQSSVAPDPLPSIVKPPVSHQPEPVVSAETAISTVRIKVEVPEQPANPPIIVAIFTYSITGRTADQTREYIASILPEYQKSVGRKGPS